MTVTNNPYLLTTAILAALFVAAIIRLWMLRRAEDKLLKNKDGLEKQVSDQQRDIMTLRRETNEWRAEMSRQFDHYRHMASDQLAVEEKRFDDYLAKSRTREHELQTSLDIARQMCTELPTVKARVLYLEEVLNRGTPKQALATTDAPTEDLATPAIFSPLPDLSTLKKK